MTDTPRANRIHIALFGTRNAGKSTLFNALLGQSAALVSPVAGTTADPVSRAMEFDGLGPIALIDTAGLDDTGSLGEARAAKARDIIVKTDLALLVLNDGEPLPGDLIGVLDSLRVAYLPVRNTRHAAVPENGLLVVNALTGEGLDALRRAIVEQAPGTGEPPLTAHLVKPGDLVLLVMPQDKQAPKGRLILPQQQVLRDLLDNGTVAVCTTTDGLPRALAAIGKTPDLTITDSQVFDSVYRALPEQARLTSFSMLMARAKGDIDTYIRGAAAIDTLKPGDKVLIAEACTHNPKDGDIGREKIPAMLAATIGGAADITVTAGADYPADLTPFRLIIHCGGCLFNRRHVLSRLHKAVEQGVPVTNYGVAIAKMRGILHKTVY